MLNFRFADTKHEKRKKKKTNKIHGSIIILFKVSSTSGEHKIHRLFLSRNGKITISINMDYGQ